MANDRRSNHIHEFSKRMIEENLDPIIEKDGAVIRIGDDNEIPLFLVPSIDFQLYSLVVPIKGEISEKSYISLCSVEEGSNKYHFKVLNRKANGQVEVGVEIGEFECKNLKNITKQAIMLRDEIYYEACYKVEKYLSKRETHFDLENAIQFKSNNDPFYPDTNNVEGLEQFLNQELNTDRGQRLYLISGKIGIGKKSSLFYVLNQLNWSGYKLKEEVARVYIELSNEYKQLCENINMNCFNSSLIIITELVTDSILRRDSADTDILFNTLRAISLKVPVILITNITHLKPTQITKRFNFVEEDSEVLSNIINVHYPNKKHREPICSDDSNIANPLYTLKKIAIENLIDTNKKSKKSGLGLPSFKESFKILTSKIVGQDKPIALMLNLIKANEKFPPTDRERSNIKILACGPPGIGKTQIGKELSKITGSNYILLPCNEAISAEFFQSKIQGSAAGYVGYQDPCVADNIVIGSRKDMRYGTTLIFDEIEKAHVKTRDQVLSLMAEGVIQTSKSTIKLENNIMYFTTNQDCDKLTKESIGFNSSLQTKSYVAAFLDDNFFRKEYLSRTDLILEFNKSNVDSESIVWDSELTNLNSLCNIKLKIENKDKLIDYFKTTYKSRIEKLGYRIIESVVRQEILGPLSLLNESDNLKGAVIYVKNKKLVVEKVR